MKVIAQNLLKAHIKFRTLWADNKKVQQRILAHDGGYEFLISLGFKETEPRKLVCEHTNVDVVHAAIVALDTKMQQLEARGFNHFKKSGRHKKASSKKHKGIPIQKNNHVAYFTARVTKQQQKRMCLCSTPLSRRNLPKRRKGTLANSRISMISTRCVRNKSNSYSKQTPARNSTPRQTLPLPQNHTHLYLPSPTNKGLRPLLKVGMILIEVRPVPTAQRIIRTIHQNHEDPHYLEAIPSITLEYP